MKNLNAVVLTPRQTTLKSLYLKDILAISHPVSQCVSHSKLTEAIRRRELTLSLEILEWYGFDGDLVILAISRLQREEAA